MHAGGDVATSGDIECLTSGDIECLYTFLALPRVLLFRLLLTSSSDVQYNTYIICNSLKSL